MKQEEVAKLAANRRAFLKGAGLTGLGLAGAAMMGNKLSTPAKVDAAAYSDVDVLNFELNLEYLEAEFYTVATTGKTLEQSGFDVIVEGYHASLLRQAVAINGVKTTALDALDVPPPPTGYDFINAGNNGLTVTRTASRVLAIVLGSHTAGTTSGGFFPQGVNGAINMV